MQFANRADKKRLYCVSIESYAFCQHILKHTYREKYIALFRDAIQPENFGILTGTAREFKKAYSNATPCPSAELGPNCRVKQYVEFQTHVHQECRALTNRQLLVYCKYN
ncbi:hypothetical protein LMH87_005270 [Akanthomyces muscarius]|uniref:Uncharacterized protein n=1 Tax=Akanthomyces muscarius TaxID=2231603 RepID=A0A9W8QNF1_AKAMU|nr:hypothetical protein LMH87_005270 [Akanthomyces muscarius]KAJ4163549.1 hypothetical protein LMH87_005270 [Akanthomyces muscarius]